MPRAQTRAKRTNLIRAAKYVLPALVLTLLLIKVLMSTYAQTTQLKSEELGFKLDYPSDWWEPKQAPKARKRTGLVAVLEQEKPRASIFLRIYEVPKPEPLRKATAALDALLSNKLTDFHKLSAYFFRLDDRLALRYAYSFTSAGGQTVVQEQLITIKGKMAYYLVLQTTPKNYRLVADDYAGVIESFEIK